MTDTTNQPPLSTAAQAVLDTFTASENGIYLEGDPDRLAAALRALASSNVVNVYQDEINCDIEYICVEDIFSIAAELEGQP